MSNTFNYAFGCLADRIQILLEFLQTFVDCKLDNVCRNGRTLNTVVFGTLVQR